MDGALKYLKQNISQNQEQDANIYNFLLEYFNLLLKKARVFCSIICALVGTRSELVRLTPKNFIAYLISKLVF